ncbi:glucuronyl esterase domain-containing protein [Catalinimonas niigatensis]|uniref:glucuronyl esterase domain-containing protein n=1 Tax=Catalinimonas niigatensis TaxID=1397264 RepID=UPI0026653482|nr:acetylxylan esterase [Catalinimonas niigatensis]WPP49142.1 acetylxylan esterase [Catalinimonas niigatensis]
MKKRIHFLVLLVFLSSQAFAQMSQQARDSINKMSTQDHQLMMKRLGITELRPGPSGNPEAPNAANADESKASPYTNLPDPLVFRDGTPVTTAQAWEKRKLEIKEDFSREIYGRVPENTPAVTWEVVSEKDTVEGVYSVHVKELLGHVDNRTYPAISVAIEMTLTTPAEINSAVPIVLEFGWNFPANWPKPKRDGPSWQEQLLEKGWGYAILIPTSFQADHGAGLREGVIGLVNQGQPRALDDWGTLRAWAWGASRAMDYFETNDTVDEERVAIEGLSRYGKAALVAMAYEPRFAMGLIGSSGAGGAKILRRVFGEQVENLASSAEYHWFAPNFIKYAGPLTPDDLPVDAHELIALCAPRPLFISVGAPDVEGQWIDARGMFLAGVHASPVYELVGKKGLETATFPPQETALLKGDIAFRQHEGGHTVGPNWPYFIQFAEGYFQSETSANE